MKTLKLLLLEDETFDVTLIQKVLQRSGMQFEAIIANDKNEFLSAIQQHSFDVILADNYLPQFDATKALQLLTDNKLTIPLILVTGTVSEDFAVKMMKAGACDYILKDRLQRLPNAILAAVEKHELEKERQKNLDKLIINEALMKEAERLAHMGSWEADPLTYETHWSDGYYRILGYEVGEVVPSLENFLIKVHPDDLEYIKQSLEVAMDNKSVFKFNFRVIETNGSLKYTENEMLIARDDQGRAIRLNGFSSDVTKRRLTENLLSRSEANLRTIFDNTESGYALLDNSLNLISFNKPLYKFSVEQLAMPLEVGKCAIDFFKPERRSTVRKILTDAVQGIGNSYEVPYPQPDGSSKWFYVSCHPVTDNSGGILGIIMSQTDITKRKESELQAKIITEDLIQRNNVLEQFAYIISHNLRGPVSTIIGISNMMQDNVLKEEEKEFFMNGITESVKKLDDVIIDLNNVIQTKNSNNENKETVYFSSILKDVTCGIHGIDNCVTITADFTEIDTMVTLKSYIHSVFYNLVSNSIKYKQPLVPAIIEISSKKTKNKIALSFKDNGMGIDLQKKGDQVFGMYKRFHIDSAEGKGVGLFMVKTQVETLGGKITIKSEVNVGTEFIIEFDQQN